MNLLLDTHTLLWCLSDDPSLDPAARQAVTDEKNTVHVSAASIWEISIKQSLGKLDAPDNLLEAIAATRFDLLPITPTYAAAIKDLPLHHRDPFDRMLVVQAKEEGMTLVTRDGFLEEYGIAVLGA